MKKMNTIKKAVSTRLVYMLLLLLPAALHAQVFSDGTVDAGTVPVSLVAFNANKINNHVQLNWTTVTETNNSHFNIQRSLNGKDFTTIAKVAGKGTLTATSNYTFTDSVIANTSLYYRLQQVDLDGKINLSSIILLKTTKQTMIEWSVYPNPIVNNKAMVTLKDAPVGLYRIALRNMTGQTVYATQYNQIANTESSQVQLPTTVNAGLYILSVTKNDGAISLSQKIIVQ